MVRTAQINVSESKGLGDPLSCVYKVGQQKYGQAYFPPTYIWFLVQVSIWPQDIFSSLNSTEHTGKSALSKLLLEDGPAGTQGGLRSPV